MNIVDVAPARDGDGLAVASTGRRPARSGCRSRPRPRQRAGRPRAALKLGIRPHRIRVGDAAGPGRAPVVSNQWLGDQAHLALDLRRLLPGRRRPPAGSTRRSATTVPVSLPPAAMHLFDADSGKALRARPRRAGGRRGMSRDVIVGVDAGTSVIKAVAFDLDGSELAAAGRPNDYVDLPGGGVEQDMARTWDDTAAVLRDLAAPGARPRRAAPLALAVTGQGDGTWLVDRDGEPVAPAWLWLDSRAAAIVRELDRSGVRAPGLPPHRLRPERLQPVGAPGLAQAPRAASSSAAPPPPATARTGSTSSSPASACTDVSEGTFTFGDFRTRAYVPEIAGGARHLAEEPRLLPPMVDGSRTTHPLTAARRRGDRPARGPAGGAGLSSTCSCTALGGGHLRAGPGDRLLDRRLDRHAHALRARRGRRCGSGREPSGYTMPFPVPGSVTQMQSNMAATSNIDWVVDRAPRGGRACWATAFDRKTTLADPRRARARGQAGGGALPPLHPRGRRARAVRRRQRPRPVHRPVDADELPRPGARGLRGLGLRRARLLRRHGPRARGDPRRRRRRALARR